MGRIRTIKPEFPQSESMGRLSRDARLLFIQLWTIADDTGRARASSRMLASLLYPYDDDVPRLIDAWLSELERSGCIRRYVVDDRQYLDIPNWLEHQKIDRPTASRLPAYVEPSRALDEPSTTDLGPGPGPVSRTKEKNAEADASADEPDFRRELFSRGTEAVVRLTGRAPSSCKSLIGRWLRDSDDEAVHVLAAIDAAVEAQLADPTAWITACLKGRKNGRDRSVLAAADRLIERFKEAGATGDYVPGSSGPRPLHEIMGRDEPLRVDKQVRSGSPKLISSR